MKHDENIITAYQEAFLPPILLWHPSNRSFVSNKGPTISLPPSRNNKDIRPWLILKRKSRRVRSEYQMSGFVGARRCVPRRIFLAELFIIAVSVRGNARECVSRFSRHRLRRGQSCRRDWLDADIYEAGIAWNYYRVRFWNKEIMNCSSPSQVC